jgi:hypothetical protein
MTDDLRRPLFLLQSMSWFKTRVRRILWILTPESITRLTQRQDTRAAFPSDFEVACIVAASRICFAIAKLKDMIPKRRWTCFLWISIVMCQIQKERGHKDKRKKELPPTKTETPDQPISNPIPSAPKKQQSDGHDDQPKSKVKIFVTPIVDFINVLGPSSSESPGEAPIAKSNCFPRFVFKIGLKITSHQLVYLDTSAGANVGDKRWHEKIMAQLDPMDYVYERTKMLMRVEGSTAVTNHYVWRVTYLAPYQGKTASFVMLQSICTTMSPTCSFSVSHFTRKPRPYSTPTRRNWFARVTRPDFESGTSL